MYAQQQSKQQSSATATVVSPASTSVLAHQQQSRRRPVVQNKPTPSTNSNTTNTATNNNKNMENEKSSVDSFLSWLTLPLEIDVTGQSGEFKKANSSNHQNSKTTQLQQQQNTMTTKQQQQKTTVPLGRQPTTTRKNPLSQPQQRKTVTVQQQQRNKGTISANNSTQQKKGNTVNNKKNEDDNNEKNSAEQISNWLTTPPDLGPPAQHQKHPHNKKRQQQQQQQWQHHPRQQAKQQKVSPKPDKRTPKQQKQKLNQQQLQRRQNPNSPVRYPKNQQKEFGELVPATKKPDLSLLSASEVRRKLVLELEVNLDPRPELPSHVPTPETIDDIDNDEPWTNKVEGVLDNALDGIHHHFSNVFDHTPENDDQTKNKMHNLNVIKYAPSFETPPQSPVSSKKTKSKLLLTPPMTKTKWGPEVWNAKKSSQTNSLSLVSSSSSTSLVSDNKSNRRNDDIVGGELKFAVFELADQDKFLREAMERKQKKLDVFELADQDKFVREAVERKQKKDAAIRKVKPTSANNVNGSSKHDSSPVRKQTIRTEVQKTIPSNATQSKKLTGRTDLPMRDCNNKTKQQSRKTNTLSCPKQTSPKKKNAATTSTSKTATTNSLQLRWMHQNALNIQASCNPRRGSIRLCDGEDPWKMDPMLKLTVDDNKKNYQNLSSQDHSTPQTIRTSHHALAA